MSQINPFTGSILQSTQAQRIQADDKSRQVRFAQARTRNASAQSDTYEPAVENAAEVQPVDEEAQQRKEQREREKKREADQDEAQDDAQKKSRLDITG